jgi:hypothetical protein
MGDAGGLDTHVLAWEGVDPPRVEGAIVHLGPDRLTAHGTGLAPGHRLTFRLVVGPGWVTEELAVQAEGDGWCRAIELRRRPTGRWDLRRGEGWPGDGPPRLGGAVALDELTGALDCDLALCPLTNTMPVRREGLLGAAAAGRRGEVALTMAWVDVPDLAVEPSPQTYAAASATAGGGAVVEFRSEGFEADIEVDRLGLVVDYPQIGRRLLPRP